MKVYRLEYFNNEFKGYYGIFKYSENMNFNSLYDEAMNYFNFNLFPPTSELRIKEEYFHLGRFYFTEMGFARLKYGINLLLGWCLKENYSIRIIEAEISNLNYEDYYYVDSDQICLCENKVNFYSYKSTLVRRSIND